MGVLIKIDGTTPLKEGAKAPRCMACIPDNARRLQRGLPQHPQGTPEFMGIIKRQRDGYVFSVWRCTQCGHMEGKQEKDYRKFDLDRPGAALIPEEMYPWVSKLPVT